MFKLQPGSPNYWMVTLVEPLAQEVPLTSEAVTVVVPVLRKVASPGLEVEKVTIEELPEVHVAELVTSVPFCEARNWLLVVVASVYVWFAGVTTRP